MSAPFTYFSDPVNRRVGARLRQPNPTLDLEGVILERLRLKKKSRAGYASVVTTKSNEIVGLLADDRNLQEVKEKLVHVEAAFLKLKEAHCDYASEIHDADGVVQCQLYLDKEEKKFSIFRQRIADWITVAEDKLLAVSLQVDSDVKPNDSISCAGTPTPSRRSRHSSSVSSRGSHTSSVALARAKEAARAAELKAEIAMLEKRQALEEKKFRLQQEESRLNLEAEIAKTSAKERAFAALTTPSLSQLKPVKLEPRFDDKDFSYAPLVEKPAVEKLNYADQDFQSPSSLCGPLVRLEKPTTDQDLQRETIALQRRQTDLQHQQNRIVEMLAHNQNRSKLPQPRVPVFDGNPMEYRTFISAFESLVETRTFSSSDRLYYLEQFTAGDVKELVRSCHHLPPDEGYDQARWLLKKKFGDEYRIASAYETKALDWPNIRPEDGAALNRFSIFLTSCRNALASSRYISNFDQPGNIQKLVFKLPYSLRERWRRTADDVMEFQARPVEFSDFVAFVNREVRIITNPVFGKISDSSRPVPGPRASAPGSKTSKSRNVSFLAQVDDTKPPATERCSRGDPTIQCLYCNRNHALEDCHLLRWKPYPERIQFLSSNKLCFGCLSDQHVSRHCPQRKTCKIADCNRKHPSILHTRPRQASTADVGTDDDIGAQVRCSMANTDANVASRSFERCRTGMAVIPVKVRVKGSDKSVVTYAFLDNGSNSSFCTDSLMKQLGVKGQRTKISLSTLERKNSTVVSNLVRDLLVSDLDENQYVSLPILYTRPEIPVNSDDIPTQGDIDQWPHLQGVFIPQVHAEVGLLIATDVPEALDPLEIKHSLEGGPYATRTRIGWAVNGPLGRHRSRSHTSGFFIRVDPELHRMVEDFYNRDFTESIVDDKTEMSQDELRFMQNAEETVKLKDGHYQISLPFKDREASVPNNKSQALQRANWLKKKLERDPKLSEDYKTFMADIVAKGYARKIPREQINLENGKVWYIPHHGVYHPHKPGKIRVVFDCSAKFNGVSLNTMLYKGPDLTNSLIGVLTRFRQDRIAVTADIQSMFYQVRVSNGDSSFLRFLWWENGDMTRELQEYQMLVHLFGAISSPACANFALRKTAEDNRDSCSLEVTNTVKRNFYVDDCLKSLPSEPNAIAHVNSLRSLLSRGGFRLTKWISNSPIVNEAIPDSERSKEIKSIDTDKDSPHVQRALGIQWCVRSDTFGFSICPKPRSPTRRGVLSAASSIFDPLGFLAPFILTAKQILQDLCRIKLEWDEEIPPQYTPRWENWLLDLPKLSSFSISRCLMPAEFGQIASSQLHHFSDASEDGYGSVSYLRLVNEEGNIHCAFLFGKSRVTPLKAVTIPRLELSAATMSVRHDRMLKREIEIPLSMPSMFWSDSMSVLRYIKNETKRFHTFVANRISMIRDGSIPNQWRYVEGTLNPGDSASRPMTAEALLSSNQWLMGPEFLWEPEEVWPQNPSLGSIPCEDPEVKADIMVSMVSMTKFVHPLTEYFHRVSSWYRLKKSIAWFLRYRDNLRRLAERKKSRESVGSVRMKDLCFITIEEMQIAELEILKNVQRYHFPEELEVLGKSENVTCVKKSSSLRSLDPIFVDGLLRVGGRLASAPIPLESKNQIILPKKDHVTNLVAKYYHIISGHSGREYVLSLVREKFWIINASSVIRRVLSKCLSCRRRQGAFCEQKMADLPADRITPDKPPFTSVGIDCFGPLQVRRGRSLVKRYGVIFTCMTIRAVHLEVAHSLDTDSFLMALRRFIARRGQVKIIRSDNATNFTSGERELRESINAWNQSKIHDTLLQKNIKWIFNPPSGSHFGGVWERCIRTTRKILLALLQMQTIDDESLSTLLCEVESIMNGRPLTTVSTDQRDLEALTPNHLLLLQSEPQLPPGLFSEEDCFSRRRWKQVQYLSNIFWRRWSKEYLPQLQIRQKWLRQRRNLTVGDVVLVSADNSPRNTWPLGRVLKVHSDKKGIVRRVTVKTKSGILERPVDKLCLLLKTEDSL